MLHLYKTIPEKDGGNSTKTQAFKILEEKWKSLLQNIILPS